MLDFFVESEGGQAEILQISGGEPTLHNNLLQIIDLAMSKNINYIMLNTNGNRLADDKSFSKELEKYENRFEVYLKFNGFTKKTDEYFDNKQGYQQKIKAIENLLSNEVPITLVAMIENGINDNEIGHILEYALNRPGIRGVNFQCVARYEYSEDSDNSSPSSVSDIINCIDQQSSSMISKQDIFPLPCNIHGNAITYLFRDGKGFVPITKLIDVSENLDFVGNTLNFDATSISNDILKKAKQQCCSFDLFDKIKLAIPPGWIRKTKLQRKSFINT